MARSTRASNFTEWGGVLALLGALLLGCGDETSSPDPEATEASEPAAAPAAAEASDADLAAEAAQLFAMRCVTCHGPEGAGDGPGSAGLTPPPRDFRDPAWQSEVSDEHIANIVQYGGAAVGRSPTMPGNPDLTGRPELVAALVAHVRSLKSE